MNRANVVLNSHSSSECQAFRGLPSTFHLMGIDWLAISSLAGNDPITEGPLAEQFIGQHLLASSDMKKLTELNYWMREDRHSNQKSNSRTKRLV